MGMCVVIRALSLVRKDSLYHASAGPSEHNILFSSLPTREKRATFLAPLTVYRSRRDGNVTCEFSGRVFIISNGAGKVKGNTSG